MNISKFFGKTVIVTKAVDELFNGNHPKGVNEGAQFEGRLIQFEIGYPVYIEIDSRRSFRSSKVTEIDEESGCFQTLNSLYKIELHPMQIDYNKGSMDKMAEEPTEMEAPAEPIAAPHYGNEAMAQPRPRRRVVANRELNVEAALRVVQALQNENDRNLGNERGEWAAEGNGQG